MTITETASATTPVERRRLMGQAFDLSGATDVASARHLAGLDWDVEHRPLYVDPPDNLGGLAKVEKERAVVRTDQGKMLGVVGREHKILTNAEMFDFAETLLEAAGTTWADSQPFGGSLNGGRRAFLAFQLGEGVTVAGQDAVSNNLLLVNGHAGNSSFQGVVTPLRDRCSNIVTASLKLGKKALGHFTIQHSGDLDQKVRQAHAMLNVQTAYTREFAALANRMADVSMGIAEFDDFLAELVPVTDTMGGRAKATAAAQRGLFRQNWNTPTLTDDLRLTAWGAINIVTEVLDHGQTDVRRSRTGADERRLNSVHFGTGARTRDRAYRILAGV